MDASFGGGRSEVSTVDTSFEGGRDPPEDGAAAEISFGVGRDSLRRGAAVEAIEKLLRNF